MAGTSPSAGCTSGRRGGAGWRFSYTGTHGGPRAYRYVLMARPRRGVARFAASIMVSLLLHGTTMAAGGTRAPFDDGWKFIRAESPLAPVLFSTRAEVERAPDEDRAVCTNVTQLPIGTATMHLHHAMAATSITACKQACCDDPTCETAQWCGPAGCGRDPSGKPSDQNTCWMGLLSNTRNSAGWQSFDMGRGHSPAPQPGPHPSPSPSPSPPEHPAHPTFALTNFDDSGWTEIDTPSVRMCRSSLQRMTAQRSHC